MLTSIKVLVDSERLFQLESPTCNTSRGKYKASWSVAVPDRLEPSLAASTSSIDWCVKIEPLHDDMPPLACPTCHDTFLHEASLATHARDVHGDGCAAPRERDTYACGTCEKQFTRKYTLTKHMKLHAKAQSLSKPRQSDTINTENKDARKQNQGEKPYRCEICSKQFAQKGTLIQHRRQHTGEKPYACDLCEKRFTRSSSLSIHMRTHTGERPYTCEVCKKTFLERSVLNRHKQIHTGDKMFKCEQCSQQFTRNGALTKHRRMHTGDKPYTCDVCTKRFSRKDVLRTHVRIHMGWKPFSCDVCHKTFSDRSNLLQHKRSHAKEGGSKDK